MLCISSALQCDNENLPIGSALDEALSIEEALDAIIHEEDISPDSKATLEIKETDDEIDNVSDSGDNEAETDNK